MDEWEKGNESGMEGGMEGGLEGGLEGWREDWSPPGLTQICLQQKRENRRRENLARTASVLQGLAAQQLC